MPPLVELARAKLNLALHVTGRRPDGYHLLDSLVVFASIGDVIALSPASVRAVKRQVVRAGDVAAGVEAFAALWGGPAHREALERMGRHRR